MKKKGKVNYTPYSNNQEVQNLKISESLFNQDLSSLRTGRANAHMLDIIKVNVYGQNMAINQLANISTPEVRTSFKLVILIPPIAAHGILTPLTNDLNSSIEL